MLRHVVEEFKLEPAGVSKYRLSVDAARRGGPHRRAALQDARPPASNAGRLEMLEQLTSAFSAGPELEPLPVLARLLFALVLGSCRGLGLPANAERCGLHGDVPADARAARGADRDGHPGDRRQRRPRVQPGGRAVHRAVSNGGARHAGHGLRDLRGGRRHGGWRQRPVGRHHRHRRRRASRRS